jgi:iron complex outermembrane receptor protein
MPSMNFGFDAANPTKWDVVKGFSSIRYTERTWTTTMKAAASTSPTTPNENLTLKFGASQRRYTFYTTARAA